MNDEREEEENYALSQIERCGWYGIGLKGKGAYGIVYQIIDQGGNYYAYKYIRSDPQEIEYGVDGLVEIDILRRVRHPNIIHAYNIFTSYYHEINGIGMILPLADRMLKDIINDLMTPVETKLYLFYKIARGLEFLHNNGILHLDIKGCNIVVKSGEPLLIDYGLSMYTDSVTIGKDDKRTRVTLDHRPPELLFVRQKGQYFHYDGAVDIWSFGITMLYAFSANSDIFDIDLTKLTINEFRNLVINMFTDANNTVYDLLDGVDVTYKELLVDLLVRILEVNPNNRLTATEICNHPVFINYQHDIPQGTIEKPPINGTYSADHRDIIKLIIYWCRNLYPDEQAVLLFLAVDLYSRTASHYANSDPKLRMLLGATCVWMSAKLTDSSIIMANNYAHLLARFYLPNLTYQDIIDMEMAVIHYSDGILYVSNLYKACSTVNQLKLTLQKIFRQLNHT